MRLPCRICSDRDGSDAAWKPLNLFRYSMSERPHELWDSIMAKGQHLCCIACVPREKVALCPCCGKVRATDDFTGEVKNQRHNNTVCKYCKGQCRDDMGKANCRKRTCYFTGCPPTWPQSAFTTDQWDRRFDVDGNEVSIICAATCPLDSNLTCQNGLRPHCTGPSPIFIECQGLHPIQTNKLFACVQPVYYVVARHAKPPVSERRTRMQRPSS